MARFTRLDERREQKRLRISLVGSAFIILFLIFFGERLLVGFSLFVDRIRGTERQTQTDQIILLSPILDTLPEATNSGIIDVTGIGTSGSTIVLYVNGVEKKKTTVLEDSSFRIPTVSLQEGENTITAEALGVGELVSDVSNAQKITLIRTRPILEVSSPEPDTNVTGVENTLSISGQTEEDISVTVNDRYVPVKSDGTFTTSFLLSEGENLINVTATDKAGNQTTVERLVNYQR